MKKGLALLLFIISPLYAQTGTGLLMSTKGENIDIESTVQVQKRLDLSDPFLVQLFGSSKASGIMPEAVNKWVMLVFEKNFKQALVSLPEVVPQVPRKFKTAFDAATLYVYYHNKLNSLFVDKWIDLSANENLLNTESGIALDYIVGDKASEMLIESGIQLSEKQMSLLKKIENENASRFNFSLQAWKALRSGKNGLRWLGKLTVNDPLRLKLSNSALIAFAKEGQLKASAKLIKEVLEPIIEKSNDTEEISNYYLSLARLLYQAGALEASRHYYSLIPEKSKFFMTARTELIWAMLQMKDLGAVKGELASLKLDLFKDKFYPEIYLVSAIANLKTCQFVEVKKNFDEFVKRNKVWAKIISNNLSKDEPTLAFSDFFYESTIKNQKQIMSEKKLIEAFENNAFWSKELSRLNASFQTAKLNQRKELKRRWQNREKILDQAIYKMRFVKVEFISRMRELARNIPKHRDKDTVSVYSAAPVRDNQLEFPYDGVLWGDELFNITAQVENLCIQQGQK